MRPGRLREALVLVKGLYRSNMAAMDQDLSGTFRRVMEKFGEPRCLPGGQPTILALPGKYSKNIQRRSGLALDPQAEA